MDASALLDEILSHIPKEILMGDRTYVRLTILKAQVDAIQPILAAHNEDGHEAYDLTPKDTIPRVYYEFDDANYGELHFLEDLRQAGIAYESSWDRGSEFGPGIEFCRFTPEGGCAVQTLYTDHYTLPIGMLRHDPTGKELHAYILDKEATITMLPWDNQEEYGRLHRMNRLLNVPGV